MTDTPAETVGTELLDVRGMRKPDKHPTIFAAFRDLPVGGSFVLVNDHDPVHLHDEFEAELPGAYSWEYVNKEIRDFRIRIGRVTSTALPRVVTSTTGPLADDGATAPSAGGAVWSLRLRERDLDSNVVVLPAGGEIGRHVGPDVDVMFHVLDGAATIETEAGDVPVASGDVVWLPKRSERRIVAGPDGVRYLTVHKHREGLQLTARTPV
jgi:uncharacterized protein (DUF2249 family)/quercetin dioxygenase-like cupin family protein